MAAMLNSLQMGFRTFAIQKRSSEVWRVLGAVKTEFQKFANVLANSASTSSRRTTIWSAYRHAFARHRRNLRAVEQLDERDPSNCSARLKRTPATQRMHRTTTLDRSLYQSIKSTIHKRTA
jgi:DNA anti-recombination protein RmuC